MRLNLNQGYVGVFRFYSCYTALFETTQKKIYQVLYFMNIWNISNIFKEKLNSCEVKMKSNKHISQRTPSSRKRKMFRIESIHVNSSNIHQYQILELENYGSIEYILTKHIDVLVCPKLTNRAASQLFVK